MQYGRKKMNKQTQSNINLTLLIGNTILFGVLMFALANIVNSDCENDLKNTIGDYNILVNKYNSLIMVTKSEEDKVFIDHKSLNLTLKGGVFDEN